MKVIQSSGPIQGHLGWHRGGTLSAALLNYLFDTVIFIRLDWVIFFVWWFSDMLAVVSEILERGVSVNFYMFHGGSNFGFMNGAMDFGTYRPQVSSYGGFRNRESKWGNVTTPVSVMQFCLPLFIVLLLCRLWRSTVRGRRLHPEISPPEAFIQPVPL